MTENAHPLRALAWKEWREQRWKIALAILVLSVQSASIVRAQLVTTAEAAVIVFGPLGLVLSIFLAMGIVPPERTQGTLHFLLAQPVDRRDTIVVKWVMGAAGLVLALVLAGVAAYLAAMSCGLLELEFAPPSQLGNNSAWIMGGNTSWLLIKITASACSGLVAFYSLLFAAMMRARNELHAGLAGILLTLLVLVWSSHYLLSQGEYFIPGQLVRSTFWYSALLNPLSPMLFLAERDGGRYLLAVVIAPTMWAGVPLLFWRIRGRGWQR